jgi:hypothetical protein
VICFTGSTTATGASRPDLLTEDVVVIDVEGVRRQGLDPVGEWARSRAHGPPPPHEPRPGPDGRFVIEISNDGGFSIEGLNDDRYLVSPAADGGFWTVVCVLDNLVTEVREFRSRVEALSGSDPPMAEA